MTTQGRRCIAPVPDCQVSSKCSTVNSCTGVSPERRLPRCVCGNIVLVRASMPPRRTSTRPHRNSIVSVQEFPHPLTMVRFLQRFPFQTFRIRLALHQRGHHHLWLLRLETASLGRVPVFPERVGPRATIAPVAQHPFPRQPRPRLMLLILHQLIQFAPLRSWGSDTPSADGCYTVQWQA